MRAHQTAFFIGLASLPSFAFAGPKGLVETLNATGTSGWVCPSVANQPASIAILAGDRLLGIFPSSVYRPDVAGLCGTAQAGFRVSFDDSMRSEMIGETNLSVLALAGGSISPLAGATTESQVPYPLPSGYLLPDGTATAFVSGTKPPQVEFYFGAPATGNANYNSATSFSSFDGGVLAATTPPMSSLPFGADLSVFPYAKDTVGSLIPLAGPATIGSSSLPFNSEVAQSGSFAGIRNSLFTKWLQPGLQITGVSGVVSLFGNTTGFSEALFLLGTTPDSQSDCEAKNGSALPSVPAVNRLWGGILKSNGNGLVSSPVAIALPFPESVVSSGGTCLATVVSAGYAFLTAPGMYTTAKASLSLYTQPSPRPTPSGSSVGIGGEFRISLPQIGTTKHLSALIANRFIVIDALSESISAAPVVNALPGSGWLPTPRGGWNVGANFYYVPANDCRQLGLYDPNNASALYAASSKTLTHSNLPPSARLISSLTRTSLSDFAIQATDFRVFTLVSVPAETVVLNPGDCLVDVDQVGMSLPKSQGILDFEDQSTVFFRTGP